MSSSGQAFVFTEPRLNMTVAGRLLVRMISAAAYALLTATALTLLLSDINSFFWAGVLLSIGLVDRALRWYGADIPLSEAPPQGTVNLARYLHPDAYRRIEPAFDRSIIMNRDVLMEVVLQLLSDYEVKESLRRLDVNLKEFKQKAEEFAVPPDAKKTELRETRYAELGTLVGMAYDVAIRNREDFIGTGDLFAAIARMDNPLTKRLFTTFVITPDDLERALLFGVTRRRTGMGRRTLNFGGWGAHRRLPHRIMNRSWTSRPTYELDMHASDLTDRARSGEIGFMIGHRNEYDRLVDVLARPANPNALLVGDAGIGKETIIAHLAHAMVHDQVPKQLFDRRLVELQLSSLLAGADQGELQRRLTRIVEEITTAGNIVLYVPDIHNLIKTSGTAYLSAADALMPIIMSNVFPIIGTTYPREFKHDIEPRTDFASIFDVIHVNEISEAEAEQLLVYKSLMLEGEYGVVVSFGAVKTAVKLAKRFFHEKYLPSSAEELLKEALVAAERRGDKFLGPNEIATVVEGKTHAPVREATGKETEQLLHLESLIHESVIGQDEAIKAVADSIREYRAGLARPGGPIASFLFVGPTGVGKTQLAKSLAKVQFGSEAALIRFDMTEYQEKASIARFIGSPDGSVSGALTEAVLEHPYSLVLLDEFEKANPDILNLFLQVLDDGRLTDNLGRVVDFSNTIIIATSNAKSDIMMDALTKGQTMNAIADYVKQRLTDVFKPELLNRFSRVVIFRDLKLAEIESVVRIAVSSLTKTLDEQGITFDISPEALAKLAKLGYNPAFGARPIRRAVDDFVRAPLAELLIKKEVARGGRVRLVLKGENEFAFESVV